MARVEREAQGVTNTWAKCEFGGRHGKGPNQARPDFTLTPFETKGVVQACWVSLCGCCQRPAQVGFLSPDRQKGQTLPPLCYHTGRRGGGVQPAHACRRPGLGGRRSGASRTVFLAAVAARENPGPRPPFRAVTGLDHIFVCKKGKGDKKKKKKQGARHEIRLLFSDQRAAHLPLRAAISPATAQFN